jgi:hypothetical protein
MICKLSQEFRAKVANYSTLLWKKLGTEVSVKEIIEKVVFFHFTGISFKTFLGGYTYACGYFLHASELNHSCDPNCYYYMVDSKIVIRAARKIRKDEGKDFNIISFLELTISYDQDLLYTSKSLREANLNVCLKCILFKSQIILGKECRCNRCNNEAVRLSEPRIFEGMSGRPSK